MPLLSQLPVPERGGEEVGRRIDEILARPEFREPPRPLLERILDEVNKRVGDLFDALTSGGPQSLVAWLIAIAVVVGVAIMATRLVRSVDRDRGRGRSRDAGERRRPAVDWRADAEAHEAKGEWRDAIRCRYRALVADLAARGLVEEVPGRTSGEYRGQVTSSVPPVAPDFASASDLFDRAWYGGLSAGADDASRLRALEDRVLARTSA